ncbi:MAG: hypothetical protein IT168_12450 [Bryobacterales bacterium]|nr:hypothetical protein [Bryobacterales bacterium]
MILEIFLCCSPADRPVADIIAARLSHGAEAIVTVDDGAAESVASKWEGGLSSAAILLLLSPDSVPPRVSRDHWGDLLDHAGGNTQPPVATVLLKDCGYPRILDRKNFFRWNANTPEVLRDLERWVLQLHQLPAERTFTPARLFWFEGREQELSDLWEALVDRSGAAALVNPAPASGKTSLAQEFARQAAANFRDVIWIGCGPRSAASVLAELAGRVGGSDFSPDPNQAFAEMLETAGRHRVLLVLDDFRDQFAIPSAPPGRASLLVTTRSKPAGGIATVRVEAAGTVSPTLPEEEVDHGLWRACAVCNPTGFPIDLAVRIANLSQKEASAACSRLIAQRLLDPCDAAARFVRLNAHSMAAAGEVALTRERLQHAQTILEIIKQAGNSPDLNQDYVPELLPAFQYANEANWQLACNIAKRAAALLRRHHRVAEAVEMLVALRDAADGRADWQISDECAWELSWIRGVPYRGAPRLAGTGNQLSLDFS